MKPITVRCMDLLHAKQGIRVSPDNLCLLAGAGAVLDVLFWLLCNPGEAVLIPGPIYPAFINDLTVSEGREAEKKIENAQV